MKGVFTSIYTRDYKGYPGVQRTQLEIPHDIFASSNEDEYLNTRKNQRSWNEESEEIVKKLYQRRLNSTYKVDYCSSHEDAALKNKDVLMDYFGELYTFPKTRKLLPPLATGRRVNGFCRPAFYYTSLSDYQRTTCQDAYDIMKLELDKGVERLGSRRRGPVAVQVGPAVTPPGPVVLQSGPARAGSSTSLCKESNSRTSLRKPQRVMVQCEM